MAVKNPGSRIRNRSASAFMLAAAVGHSLIPLFVAWGGSSSPFLFNTLWKVGVAIATDLRMGYARDAQDPGGAVDGRHVGVEARGGTRRVLQGVVGRGAGQCLLHWLLCSLIALH